MLKCCAFYHNLHKIRPIQVDWTPLVVMKPLPHGYIKIREKVPKRQTQIGVYHVNVGNPLGEKRQTREKEKQST